MTKSSCAKQQQSGLSKQTFHTYLRLAARVGLGTAGKTINRPSLGWDKVLTKDIKDKAEIVPVHQLALGKLERGKVEDAQLQIMFEYRYGRPAAAPYGAVHVFTG